MLVLTPDGAVLGTIPESGEGLIPAGTKFPLSQDRSIINVRTTWPANRRLSRFIVVTGGMIARVGQVDIDRRRAGLSPWIYIANQSLINCRHEIAAEFRSIIIIVDCGPGRMIPMRKGDTNHSFGRWSCAHGCSRVIRVEFLRGRVLFFLQRNMLFSLNYSIREKNYRFFEILLIHFFEKFWGRRFLLLLVQNWFDTSVVMRWRGKNSQGIVFLSKN